MNLGKFVEDVKQAIKDIKENPKDYSSKLGSLYGATSKISNKNILAIILNDFLDCQMAVNIESSLYGLYD